MSQLVASLDAQSKRLLTIAVSMAIIFLSLTCLIYSVQGALASPRKSLPLQMQPTIGVGCDAQYVYYFNSRGQLKKLRKDVAQDF
ncbi:hypothetical protein GCM10028818_60490 [Spirosoma horti]